MFGTLHFATCCHSGAVFSVELVAQIAGAVFMQRCLHNFVSILGMSAVFDVSLSLLYIGDFAGRQNQWHLLFESPCMCEWNSRHTVHHVLHAVTPRSQQGQGHLQFVLHSQRFLNTPPLWLYTSL